MKKFYALAAAACAALSMNAQLYVVGNGEGLGWDPLNPMEVEAADGAYTFEINDLVAFKLSTVKGVEGDGWAEFNTACYVANITKDVLGTPVALELGDANIETPWKGNYKIVVAGDYSTITMTTTTPEPNGPAEVYVRGGMNGWGAEADWMFTQKEGNTYEITCTIEAGVEFKIADADWGSINYGAAGTVTVDEELFWNYNDNNSVLDEDFTGTITIVLPEVAKDELSVYFKTDDPGSVGIVAAEGAAEYFNLQGVRVAQPENGLYIVRQNGKVSKQVIR